LQEDSSFILCLSYWSDGKNDVTHQFVTTDLQASKTKIGHLSWYYKCSNTGTCQWRNPSICAKWKIIWTKSSNCNNQGNHNFQLL